MTPHDRDEQADDEWGTGFAVGVLIGLAAAGLVYLLPLLQVADTLAACGM